MVFDQGAFSEFVEDGRYDLLKKPVKIDKSNRAYEIQFVPPATTKGSYILPAVVVDAGPASFTQQNVWNYSSQTHYIDVYAGSDYKANLQGSYLKITYYVAQSRAGNGAGNFLGCPVAPNAGACVTMPWNPLYMFQTIALKGNQSQTPIEQYINNNNLQHISTLRYLLKYKHDALETHDQTLFTPCIESAFDIVGAASTESIARSTRWCGASGVANAAEGPTTQPKYMTKCIPLSDIFECCESPGIYNNLNRFRIEFTLRDPQECVYTSGLAVNAGLAGLFMTDIQFVFDATRMAPVQAIETAVEKQHGSIENVGYFQNEVIPWTYSPNSQIVATGQRDVQMVAFGLPSIGLNVNGPLSGTQLGSACINPLQYWNGQLSSINCQYGSDMPLRTPLSLSTGAWVVGAGNKQQSIYNNSVAYTLMVKCCNADRASLVPVAVPFINFPMYHLYCFPIYNQSMVHRNADPKDIRIDNSSPAVLAQNPAVTAYPSVIIIRKFAGLQVDSSGSIDRL